MPTVDYLPVATSVSADVDPQATFAGSGYQVNGFVNGIALPNQCNKVWRQASMIASAVANFIANQTGENVLDDGNLTNLVDLLTEAINDAASGAQAPSVLPVAFAAHPTYNCAASGVNPLIAVFTMTLTGNITTAPTVSNMTAGQLVFIVYTQDATGGRTIIPPSGFQGGGSIDGTANATSVQGFLAITNTIAIAITPVMVP